MAYTTALIDAYRHDTTGGHVSRYSERHAPQGPSCYVDDCDTTASKLINRHDGPQWSCLDHADDGPHPAAAG